MWLIFYILQRNGVAKYKNRILLESARCMLQHKQFFNVIWAKAINTTVYIVDRACTMVFLVAGSPQERQNPWSSTLFSFLFYFWFWFRCCGWWIDFLSKYLSCMQSKPWLCCRVGADTTFAEFVSGVVIKSIYNSLVWLLAIRDKSIAAYSIAQLTV